MKQRTVTLAIQPPVDEPRLTTHKPGLVAIGYSGAMLSRASSAAFLAECGPLDIEASVTPSAQ